MAKTAEARLPEVNDIRHEAYRELLLLAQAPGQGRELAPEQFDLTGSNWQIGNPGDPDDQTFRHEEIFAHPLIDWEDEAVRLQRHTIDPQAGFSYTGKPKREKPYRPHDRIYKTIGNREDFRTIVSRNRDGEVTDVYHLSEAQLAEHLAEKNVHSIDVLPRPPEVPFTAYEHHAVTLGANMEDPFERFEKLESWRRAYKRPDLVGFTCEVTTPDGTGILRITEDFVKQTWSTQGYRTAPQRVFGLEVTTDKGVYAYPMEDEEPVTLGYNGDPKKVTGLLKRLEGVADGEFFVPPGTEVTPEVVDNTDEQVQDWKSIAGVDADAITENDPAHPHVITPDEAFILESFRQTEPSLQKVNEFFETVVPAFEADIATGNAFRIGDVDKQLDDLLETTAGAGFNPNLITTTQQKLEYFTDLLTHNFRTGDAFKKYAEMLEQTVDDIGLDGLVDKAFRLRGRYVDVAKQLGLLETDIIAGNLNWAVRALAGQYYYSQNPDEAEWKDRETVNPFNGDEEEKIRYLVVERLGTQTFAARQEPKPPLSPKAGPNGGKVRYETTPYDNRLVWFVRKALHEDEVLTEVINGKLKMEQIPREKIRWWGHLQALSAGD